MNKQKVINKLHPLFKKGVAHRGLHNENDTENSLAAFKNAKDHQIPIELDVHLTFDDQLIVCHDSELKRVTSRDGLIEQLSLTTIKEDYVLLNGEQLPTLKEVLDLIDESVPIVIELKPDTKTKNYKKLALKVLDELKNVKDKSKFMIISFYPQCLFPFKNKGFIRALLLSIHHQKVYFFRHFFEALDVEQTYFKIKKYQNMNKNKYVMTWTITNQKELDNVIDYVDNITYQEIDPQIIIDTLDKKY